MEPQMETQTILVPTKEAKAMMERVEKPEERETLITKLTELLEKVLTYENCQRDSYLKSRIMNKNEIQLKYIEEYRPVKEITDGDKSLVKEALSKVSNCTLREKDSVLILTKFKPKRNTIVIRKITDVDEFKQHLETSNLDTNKNINFDYRKDAGMLFMIGNTVEFTQELYQFLLKEKFKGEKIDCQLCEEIIESKSKSLKNAPAPQNIYPISHMPMIYPMMYPYFPGPMFPQPNSMGFKPGNMDDSYDNNMSNPNMNPGNIGGGYRGMGRGSGGYRGMGRGSRRGGRYMGSGRGNYSNRGRGAKRNNKEGGGPVNVSDQDFPALSNRPNNN